MFREWPGLLLSLPGELNPTTTRTLDILLCRGFWNHPNPNQSHSLPQHRFPGIGGFHRFGRQCWRGKIAQRQARYQLRQRAKPADKDSNNPGHSRNTLLHSFSIINCERKHKWNIERTILIWHRQNICILMWDTCSIVSFAFLFVCWNVGISLH